MVLVRVLLCLLCFFGFIGLGGAASADSRGDGLGGLRAQIRNLQKDLQQSEESHDEVLEGLAAVDKSVSLATRRLREISFQRERIEQELLTLTDRVSMLEDELRTLRVKLGDTLFRLYVEGGQGGVRPFLSGDGPNQLARDAFYMERLARQRMDAIEQARHARVELQRLIDEVVFKRDALIQLESERKQEQDALLREKRKQQEVLQKIASQLRGQKKQLDVLRRDEARMEKLLRGLEKITKTAPGRKAQSSARTATASPRSAGAGPESHVDSASRQAGLRGGGRLRWPVSGRLKARFGEPRLDGGSAWKGVFIAVKQGAEVRCIASGVVVFSDWLRGFGNLIIVDHGEDYMSVYGNNDAIYKTLGDQVLAGDVLASAGSSGGLEESGLYFEIRHRGQPQDPAKWMADK